MAANFISIDAIIDSIQLQSDFGDYVNSKTRYQLKELALRGVSEMDLTLTKNLRSLDRVVNGDGTIDIPEDYLDYVAIYALGPQNQLITLYKNKRLNVSLDYVLDNEGKNVKDDKGEFIYSIGPRVTTYSESFPVITDGDDDRAVYGEFTRVYAGTNYGLGGGGNNYGQYKIDIINNTIQLNVRSDVKMVVLDYVSDSLSTKYDVVVPVALRESIYAWIYWKAIEYNKNTPDREKERAMRVYDRAKRIAKRKMNRFRLEEWLYTGSRNQMQSLKF